MKKSTTGFSTGIPLPKINYRKQKAKLKRDLRKKDKQFQESIPEGASCAVAKIAGTQKCVGSLTRHHLVKRRFLQERHKESNSLILCHYHHIEDLHRHGEKTFMKKYFNVQ